MRHFTLPPSQHANDATFQIDGFSREDMAYTIKKYDIKSPHKNNDLSEPMQFNLMFSTNIGPTGDLKGFVCCWQGVVFSFQVLC